MTQFTDTLPDVFAALGPVTIKRMFGGAGIWYDSLMCALVANDTLYLKTDDATRPFFDALALPAFEYARGGKTMATSYRQAPETVFEDRQEAAVWVRRAFEAALRTANARPASKPRQKNAPAKKAAKRQSPAASTRSSTGRKASKS